MLKLLVRLSTLSLGLSFVVCTTASQQSQLASLNDRMSQVINALYSSPLLSQSASSTTPSEEYQTTSTSQDPTYTLSSSSTPPQVVYVSSSPSYLEAGAEPTDYAYPTPSNPVTRSVYPYEFSYPQYTPQIPVFGPVSGPYPMSRTFSPFPSPVSNRPIYPSLPSPSSPALPIPQPFPSQVLYPPVPYTPQVPYSAPVPYPTPVQYAPPAAFPNMPYAPSFSPAPLPITPSLPGPFPPIFQPAMPQPPGPYYQPGFPHPVYSQVPYPSPYASPVYPKLPEVFSKSQYQFSPFN